MPGWIFSGRSTPPPRPTPPTTEPPATETPKPLPALNWANPVHTTGACICDVIYSECRCEQRSSTAP